MAAYDGDGKDRTTELMDLAARARRLSRTITDERTTAILTRVAEDCERQARDHVKGGQAPKGARERGH